MEENLINDFLTGKNLDMILDILLVCADKPVNYSNLHKFTYSDLWKAAKSFAATRNHTPQMIYSAIQDLQEAIKNEKIPELIGFDGVALASKELNPSGLYYARERHFQDVLFKLCKGKIEESIYNTLGLSIEKARQRECQIAQIYLQYLNDILFHDQPIAGITLDIDKLKRYYHRMYEREMPQTITYNLIIEVLQMARLGYEYDGKFYPFWYTVREDTGPKFRKQLSDSIAARMS
jgi:hypothetical protein